MKRGYVTLKHKVGGQPEFRLAEESKLNMKNKTKSENEEKHEGLLTMITKEDLSIDL